MAQYELALFPLLLCVCQASAYVPFDHATATSVNSAGSDGRPDYAATNANSFGGSYWCSGGGHAENQVVVWTGTFSVSRRVSGVKLHWSYSPDDVKILVSPNGADFSEVTAWRRPSQPDVSFAEHFMFDEPASVRALTVLMRKPRAWGYFGLNSVSVIAENRPAMLISGMSAVNEKCIAASQSNASVSIVACVDAIAAGDGREVFEATINGQIKSTARPDLCLSLVGDAMDGGYVGLQPCRNIEEGNDARGKFEFTATGQIRLPRMGDFCLMSESGGADGASFLGAQDCTRAASSVNAADKFFLQAVREENRASAEAAKTSAILATKSAARLTGLLTELARAAESCGLLTRRHQNETESAAKMRSALARSNDIWDSSTASLVRQLGVDRETLVATVQRARDMLAEIQML
jgi:hypothetical protein